MARVSQSDEQR